MPGQQDMNFQPTVKCPFCGKPNRPTISGWGREGLNMREKTCKHCQQTYSVVLYVTTDKDLDIVDGTITGIQSRIDHLKKRTRELKQGLLDKHAEWAEEYIRTEASTRGRQN